jgi:hypothetical protein
VTRFSRRTWPRPGGEDFFRWRYLEAPAQRVMLALRGEEVVATIAAFQRDYLIGGRRQTCLETLDWFCLPEYRGSGIGIRVLQGFMKVGEPIIAVGGTADTLSLLPRLGWRRLAVASAFRLPLDGESVGQSLRRRFRLPARVGRTMFDRIARPWFEPRVRRRPAGGEVTQVAAPGDDLLPLYEGDTGYGVLPLPHLPHLRWLTGGFPAMGPFVILHFLVRGTLRGWTLLRASGPEGRQEVTLVEAYAPRPDESLTTWMISESLVHAAEWSPLAVNTQTTCPILRRALQRNRFLSAGEVPIHVWPGDLAGAAGPFHLVQNASDGALIPYPVA